MTATTTPLTDQSVAAAIALRLVCTHSRARHVRHILADQITCVEADGERYATKACAIAIFGKDAGTKADEAAFQATAGFASDDADRQSAAAARVAAVLLEG